MFAVCEQNIRVLSKLNSPHKLPNLLWMVFVNDTIIIQCKSGKLSKFVW